MKKIFFAVLALFACLSSGAAERKIIRISTDRTDLVLQVAENGRLYQSYLGERLRHEADLEQMAWDVHAATDGSVSQRGWEAYAGSGAEDFFEAALAVTHADGNPSTILRYVSSEQRAVEGGTETVIRLRGSFLLGRK